MILGLDKSSREYTSWRDNSDNPREGYSWAIYTNIDKWTMDDLIISAETWGKEYWKEKVSIERIEEILIK